MNLFQYRNVTENYKGNGINKSVLQNLAYLSDRDGAFTVDVQVLSRNVGGTEDRVRQAGQISIKYGFRGPNYSTVSACASSTHSIIDAINSIRMGRADIFVTGGSEAAINEPGIGGFNSMQALSTNNEEYLSASRPFDKTRDGFVMGEGAGALVVEELEHARARGAKIYAELAGTGMTADAYHLTQPHPEGLGAANVMEFAIQDAGLRTEDIDYINVHGTSTPLGDISETKAMKNNSDQILVRFFLAALGFIFLAACSQSSAEEVKTPPEGKLNPESTSKGQVMKTPLVGKLPTSAPAPRYLTDEDRETFELNNRLGRGILLIINPDAAQAGESPKQDGSQA